jgi:ribosomal protein S12 methylthiotransferase accessory factor YcaO
MYFTFPNFPNDVWLGTPDDPSRCVLVCSFPSDGPVKASTVAALLNCEAAAVLAALESARQRVRATPVQRQQPASTPAHGTTDAPEKHPA